MRTNRQAPGIFRQEWEGYLLIRACSLVHKAFSCCSLSRQCQSSFHSAFFLMIEAHIGPETCAFIVDRCASISVVLGKMRSYGANPCTILVTVRWSPLSRTTTLAGSCTAITDHTYSPGPLQKLVDRNIRSCFFILWSGR